MGRTVRIEPVDLEHIEISKSSGGEDASVRTHGEAGDKPVLIGLEGGVQRAVGAKTQNSRDTVLGFKAVRRHKNAAIALNGEAGHAPVQSWYKGLIERAVRLKPCESWTGDTRDTEESATDEN